MCRCMRVPAPVSTSHRPASSGMLDSGWTEKGGRRKVMSLADWLAAFRELHEKAHRGELAPRERAAYHAGRDELARALLAAQRLT